MLTIIVPAFDLGMSFGKFKSEKNHKKSVKGLEKDLEIYIQNCGKLSLKKVW